MSTSAKLQLPRRTRHLGLTLGVVAALAAAAAAESEPPKPHWAFQPLRRTAPPAVAQPQQARTPLDCFVLSRLEARGLSLSAPAEKGVWLRRVTLDLVGVPPTTAELDAYLADDRPDADARVVERLLADPRYGETWGRLWLDLVRFAETAGFNADPLRPLAYKYRDYVIRSFNADLPYDRFIAEQLAGDEVAPESPDAQAATGYNRMWPDESNASDVLLARQAALNDLTGNVGAVFLGLSIGCAQCHDHKFDPLLQTDFYHLQAFFAGIVLQDDVPVATTAALDDYHRRRQQWMEETAEVRRELHALETAGRRILGEEKRLKFPAEVLDAIDTAPERRTPRQRQLAFWSERQIEINDKDLPSVLDDFARERREFLRKEWEAAKQREPKPPARASVMAVREVSAEPPQTHLLAAGSYDVPLEETPPAYPVVLRRTEADAPRIVPPRGETSGRRSELARWLASPDHPLTHRVVVNRIWQGHFGKGLVENANDFGTQTPPPSHPELLDWLTAEFIDGGFSWKQLHRQIVLSATYRQAADRADVSSPQALAADPDNTLYWHFPRQRLTSERIRDSWLAVSGQLNDALYGPGVRPELPPNFGGAAAWKVSEAAGDRVRRSVYIFAKRNLPYPMMQAFDFPDMHESCGERTQTIIAPQALMLLNSDLVLQAAGMTARRAAEAAGTADPQASIRELWRLAYSREPTPAEIAAAQRFVARQTQVLTAESQPPADGAAAADAWTDLAHAVLNSNEFLYVE